MSALRRVDSPKNPVLKQARALQTKRERRDQRRFVIEGEDLLAAALSAGVVPDVVLFDEARVARDDELFATTSNVAARYLAPTALIAGVSTLAAPPRVLAIVPTPGPHHFRTVTFPPIFALFLAGVGDPGNVGSLVRTAATLGADWVAVGPGSADPFHPRAVRAAMGATFAIPLLEGVQAADLATRDGFSVVAAVLDGGDAPWDVDFTQPIVIALGAERLGLAEAEPDLPVERTIRVTIPQVPGADSLNVTAAGAVLMAEAVRQRSRKLGG